MEISYVCTMVFPSPDTIMLLSADEKIVKMRESLSSERSAHDDAIVAARARSRNVPGDTFSEKVFTMSSLFNPLTFAECAILNIHNMDEYITISSPYDSITKTKVMSSRLTEILQTPYTDLCFHVEVKMSNGVMFDAHVVAILPPIMWRFALVDIPNSVKMDDSASSNDAHAGNGNDVFSSPTKIASALHESSLVDTGMFQVVALQNVASHVPPYEYELVLSIHKLIDAASKEVSPVLGDSVQRYLEFDKLEKSKRIVSARTTGVHVELKDNIIHIQYVDSSPIIKDADYHAKVMKNVLNVSPRQGEFVVKNPDAHIIYCVRSMPAIRFLSSFHAKHYIVDTDLVESDLNAQVLFTSDIGVLSKYENTYAFIPDEKEWVRAHLSSSIQSIERKEYATFIESLKFVKHKIAIPSLNHISNFIRFVNQTGVRKSERVEIRAVVEKPKVKNDVDNDTVQVNKLNPKLNNMILDNSSSASPSNQITAAIANNSTEVQKEQGRGERHEYTYDGGKKLANKINTTLHTNMK